MSSDEHPATPPGATAGTPDDRTDAPSRLTPDQVGARLVELLGPPAEATVSGGADHARATVDVPPARWAEALRAARDRLGCAYFDWLSAVDEEAEGFSVVAHLWSVPGRYGVLLRTRVPRDAPRLASVVDVFPGASWHERETYEMFGVVFDGHPDLKPLLLPPEFEGHPLRKEFVLASRVAKAWPGAKEPGESEHAPARGRRQPMRPPGVPDPNEWGPQAGTMPPADTGADRRTPAPRARGPRAAGRGPGTDREARADGGAGTGREAGTREDRSDRARGEDRDGER
jgi:NADH-quinone oxidoreductase subunit C